MCSQLRAAGAAADRGNPKAQAGSLGAYINLVSAKAGKALTVAHAATLVRLAESLDVTARR